MPRPGLRPTGWGPEPHKQPRPTGEMRNIPKAEVHGGLRAPHTRATSHRCPLPMLLPGPTPVHTRGSVCCGRLRRGMFHTFRGPLGSAGPRPRCLNQRPSNPQAQHTKGLLNQAREPASQATPGRSCLTLRGYHLSCSTIPKWTAISYQSNPCDILS